MKAWPTTPLGKLSPWLHQIMAKEPLKRRMTPLAAERQVCAFVRITADADEVLQRYHCQELSRMDDIHIAQIPLKQLKQMATDPRVGRIEASPLGEVMLDSTATFINALPVYEGRNLPQAYTGQGVVVGVMDIGFDLTCPNFYSRDMSQYRIKAFWDMLSTDTLASTLPVGRDFVGTEALLDIQHSRDGNDFTHGTHTLGIAAGSGYNSSYRGLAYESDICVVANAVSNNKTYIDPADEYKYTDALNALGFKYIFDYAERVGKPCVVSLSEGGTEDLWGENQLYYEMLEKLTGPGRIMVASAGNMGHRKTWMRKEKGLASKGTFLLCGGNMMVTLKSADDFQFRLVSYGTERNDTLLLSTQQVLQSQDSLFSTTFAPVDSVKVGAYPSCYNPDDVCYDVVLYNTHSIGLHTPLSLELLGAEADVELWKMNATLTDNDVNPLLNGAERTHNVNTPSAAPCVISVGATSYRTFVINAQGDTCVYLNGDRGRRALTSSVGPTVDGRIKPDVMAPGNNIISSYSSFYIAAHPEASDIRWNTAYYDYNGRTYAWNCNSGTSSSCPMVAGAIALWLQANPRLTPHDVLDVIAQTSRPCDPSLSYPNNEYGYGEIDVYRGLLHILDVDHIDAISHHPSPVRVTREDDCLVLQFPQAVPADMMAAVYLLSGIRVGQFTIPAGSSDYRIPVPQLRRQGIHAIQLGGYQPYSGSMLF
jgi:subtilisin family serine protease